MKAQSAKSSVPIVANSVGMQNVQNEWQTSASVGNTLGLSKQYQVAGHGPVGCCICLLCVGGKYLLKLLYVIHYYAVKNICTYKFRTNNHCE